jgi:hypothetical protein
VRFVLGTTATCSGLDADPSVGFVLDTCAVFGGGPGEGFGGAEDADINTGSNTDYGHSRTLKPIFQ